jgi:hypothetical protein
MDVAEKSLRSMIEKWFMPSSETSLRVSRFGRRQPNRRHCVRVEALRPAGPLAILFFRHDDGAWRVFPPEARRPALSGFYSGNASGLI